MSELAAKITGGVLFAMAAALYAWLRYRSDCTRWQVRPMLIPSLLGGLGLYVGELVRDQRRPGPWDLLAFAFMVLAAGLVLFVIDGTVVKNARLKAKVRQGAKKTP